MGSDIAFHTCPRCGQWHMVGMWCEPKEVQPNPKESTMPTDDRPEDLANRDGCDLEDDLRAALSPAQPDTEGA